MKLHEEILTGEFRQKTKGFNKPTKPLKMSSLSERVCSHARGIPFSQAVVQQARNAVFHSTMSNNSTVITGCSYIIWKR